MSTSTPDPDAHASLREALQRDAARVPEPPFDAVLHRATMRRIQALAEAAPARSGSPGWNWTASLSAATALGVICLLAFLWLSRGIRRNPVQIASFAKICPPRATVLAYQRAMNGRQDAFFEMLDRDAQTLLPPSSKVFSNLLD